MNPNDLRERVADAIFANIDLVPWQRAELVERTERESFIRVMGDGADPLGSNPHEGAAMTTDAPELAPRYKRYRLAYPSVVEA